MENVLCSDAFGHSTYMRSDVFCAESLKRGRSDEKGYGSIVWDNDNCSALRLRKN